MKNYIDHNKVYIDINGNKLIYLGYGEAFVDEYDGFHIWKTNYMVGHVYLNANILDNGKCITNKNKELCILSDYFTMDIICVINSMQEIIGEAYKIPTWNGNKVSFKTFNNQYTFCGLQFNKKINIK